jgi:lysozyme
MTAEEVASALIERWEGFRERPYLCPAGVPTVGYGFTHYADGRRVALTDPPMGQEQARLLLRLLILTRYFPTVMKLCPECDTPERVGALVDFCYNLGEGKLKASTLRRRIRERRWADVPQELRKWIKGGGRTLPGLVLRREAEVGFI